MSPVPQPALYMAYLQEPIVNFRVHVGSTRRISWTYGSCPLWVKSRSFPSLGKLAPCARVCLPSEGVSKMPSDISWSTNDRGSITGAPLHDATVQGLSFAHNQSLSLSFSKPSQETYIMELTGLKQIGIIQFRNGAILSDVLAWPCKDAPVALGVPDGPWNLLFGGDLCAEDVTKAADKTRRSEPDAILLQVLCSYGGALAALGRQLILRKL